MTYTNTVRHNVTDRFGQAPRWEDPCDQAIVIEWIKSNRGANPNMPVGIGGHLGQTGSRYENLHNNGVSHFIEHMLFKGTEKYGAKDIADIFDGIGGNVNAFTAKEYTCYYAKVLDEHLETALEVLSDMFFHSKFDPEDLEKEKRVVFEEIAMYDDTPDDLVHDLIAKAAYADHPLAYSILGTQETLAPMNRDTLLEYTTQHYSMPNTVVSIAGNVDDSVFSLVERFFADAPSEGQLFSTEAPVYAAETMFHKKKTEQQHICLALPGCSLQDDLLYPMIILNNIIGGGMSSRLFQEIREKRGLAYSVYSYHSAHLDSGLFTIYMGTAPKQTKEVLKLTEQVLADIQTHAITEQELHKGKEQLKGNLILSLESTGSRMNRLGKNELMLGQHYSLDELIAKIQAVTMDQVRALTKRMFSQPFAAAMVGNTETALKHFRRDSLVSSTD